MIPAADNRIKRSGIRRGGYISDSIRPTVSFMESIPVLVKDISLECCLSPFFHMEYSIDIIVGVGKNPHLIHKES